MCFSLIFLNIINMFKNWKRKAKRTVSECIQITEDNRNKNDKECLRNQKVIKELVKSICFMTWNYWATRSNYEELTCFVVEDLEKNDLEYHSETMKKNGTCISVVMLDELHSAINKHIEAGTTMELSLVNKFTLRADEFTSMLDPSELHIFIKYLNLIINTLCERFLCLTPLGSSKSASALHKAIVKVFSELNVNIKNIFLSAFDGNNTISTILIVFKDICVSKVCFGKILVTGAIALLLIFFTWHKSMKFKRNWILFCCNCGKNVSFPQQKNLF